MNRMLIWLAVVVGVICLGLSVYYWITPAGALPAFLPGHEAGATLAHHKHAIAALIVAVALFIFAWFRSGPRRTA